MLELVQSGGWLMAPILLCSVVATAICIERAWALRRARVAPDGLVAAAHRHALSGHGATAAERFADVAAGNPLARILAAGLSQAVGEARLAPGGRLRMKEAMETAADAVLHDLERHLTLLGTIASASPLLGLLGTVIGMIEVFALLVREGGGNAALLAGGISQALITTAAGLAVAIPALILHRYFGRRVEELTLALSHQASRFVDLVYTPDGRPAG